MLKILDLFAGAGGLSLGFEKTGQFANRRQRMINTY